MADAREMGWAIVELMGHRRLAGRVSEEMWFGVPMCRIDIPSEPPVTQYYGGGAVFSCTPTTEEIARAVAAHGAPGPVQRWELPVLSASTRPAEKAADSEDEEDEVAEVERDFDEYP